MSNNIEFEGISFDLPKNRSNVIKVIGVGGGGSNAINHMFKSGINGVDFVICNTDAQALQNSPIPNKIQLGVTLTEGLGAGANPEVGEQSALESFEEIKTMLGTNTKMIFITAGMGGGTGTGAAPVIAKMAKELDVLTVGIVTIPFQFEGKIRNEQAKIGIEKLRKEVDSLIVINNNKLREVYGNLGFKAGFAKADEVLATAAKGIAEVITHHYIQNIDLRDAKTVLANSGSAIMGSATATGENRAKKAIMKALDSPLLNDNKITGAKNVLLLIISGSNEITLDEMGEINDYIQTEAGFGANIIMGVGDDENLTDEVIVTVIATGFDASQQDEIANTEVKKIIHILEDNQTATQMLSVNNVVSEIELPIEKPVVETKNKPTEPKVIHNLFEDELLERKENTKTTTELIPTTDLIKEIEVIYNEVEPSKNKVNSDEFVITDISQIEIIEEIVEEEQAILAFDIPASTTDLFEPLEHQLENKTEDSLEKISEEKKITFNLTDEDISEIQVNAPTEIMSITEQNQEEITKYTLEVREDEKSNVEETKTIDSATEMTKKVIDPIELSAKKSLKLRAEERKKSLDRFNYKFRQNLANNIDEIEKEPAYKRMNVNLDVAPEKNNISRTTLGTDANNDDQLRSNNSFLHDNVD